MPYRGPGPAAWLCVQQCSAESFKHAQQFMSKQFEPARTNNTLMSKSYLESLLPKNHFEEDKKFGLSPLKNQSPAESPVCRDQPSCSACFGFLFKPNWVKKRGRPVYAKSRFGT